MTLIGNVEQLVLLSTRSLPQLAFIFIGFAIWAADWVVMRKFGLFEEIKKGKLKKISLRLLFAPQTNQISYVKSIDKWRHFDCVLIEKATSDFHLDSVSCVARISGLENLNLTVEIRADQWRVDQSFVLVVFVSLPSIEVRNDQCRLIVLHLQRCQSLFIPFQVSRFGHPNYGDFLGAVLLLLFVGRSGCFAIWSTDALREAFLHDAPLASATVCIVAGVCRQMNWLFRDGSRNFSLPTSTWLTSLLLNSSLQHEDWRIRHLFIISNAQYWTAFVLWHVIRY